MAPRFVEVSRPVQEGVAWAASLPDQVKHNVRSFIPTQGTQRIINLLQNITATLPEFAAVSDLKLRIIALSNVLPPLQTQTKYFLLIACLALVARQCLIWVRSRAILAHYGAAKLIEKTL